ncbi:MAG: Fur family transcriptional regulator [Alphaproteobacteria bacterium]
MSSADAFPEPGHDHGACVADILTAAERVCGERRVRLTTQRRQVLEIVAERHAAIGAYEIMERMAEGGRRPAPVTVYRALEFLIDNGLVHRLASLNAFIACAHPAAEHGAQFLICRQCGRVAELADDGVLRAIDRGAARADFDVSAPIVEVVGTCAPCRDKAA